nr:capsid protein [Mamastrovirus sp.]
MAGKQPQHAPVKAAAKAAAKEVVKEEKKVIQQIVKPKVKWQNNRKWQPKPRVKREIQKKLKKEGLEGPKTRFSVTVAATIGKIGPNKQNGPELQISTFLHPSLMKEPNDGTNFGPLQAAAAQWGLWKLVGLKITFTPLVGASAVTGSVYRVSLNLTQSPGNTSWGGLGARKHLDIPTGKSVTWSLHKGDLAGPRQTWWLTDTNEEGGQSCGPMIEVHGLGVTTSTYKDAAWAGDLFIVEVRGVWHFANYNAKPALGALERKTESLNASMEVGSDGVLTMSLPSSSQLAKHMSERYERSGANATGVGETIWQIVDEGAGLISHVAPPPFGWLIKGGWWFVKRILGRSNTGEDTYQVFASLADAQNNKPVMANPMQKATHPTTLISTQINAPNTGPGNTSGIVVSSGFPIPQSGVPEGAFVVSGPFEAIHICGHGTAAATTLVNGYIPSNPWEFTLKKGSTIWGAAQGGVVAPPDHLLCFSFDSENECTGWYDIHGITSTGITVDWKTNATTVTEWADVLAWRSDDWNTLRMTYYLCRVRKNHTPTDYEDQQRIPLPTITSISDNKAVTAVHEVKMTQSIHTAGGNTMQVKYNTIRAGNILILWQLGSHTFNDATGQASVVSQNSFTAYQLNVEKRSTTGMWVRALTPIGPKQEWLTALFHSPARQQNLVDQLMDQIQERFALVPRPSADTDSSEDEFEDISDPKTAKLALYEALKGINWPHDAAETVMDSLIKNRRGHAE